MIDGHTIDVIEHNLAIIAATNATKTLIAALSTLETTESDDDKKLPPLTPYVDDDLPKIIAIYSNDQIFFNCRKAIVMKMLLHLFLIKKNIIYIPIRIYILNGTTAFCT